MSRTSISNLYHSAMSIRVLSLFILAACTDQLSVAEVDQSLGGQCPIWQCGSNSPFIDNYSFHEANKYGLPNDAGFRIVSFKDRWGTPLQLDVAGGHMIGRNTQGIGVLFGQQLVGSTILMVNSLSQRQFLVRVNAVGSVFYWATLPTGVQPSRETYLLEWVLTIDGVNPAPNSRYQNVCKLAGRVAGADLLGMNGYHTVLFEGERINAAAKTIDPRLDIDWFNIGCAGHTLAKLELTGHTEVAHYVGFTTTIDQRQTMLKMLVADYTGSGIPYTIAWHAAQLGRRQWLDEAPADDHRDRVAVDQGRGRMSRRAPHQSALVTGGCRRVSGLER